MTDILSEIYGKKRAERVVTSGLVASLFVMGLVLLSSAVEATSWSPVDDAVFSKVFGLQWAGVSASMVAYLGAQYLDIRLFHFWKRLTKRQALVTPQQREHDRLSSRGHGSGKRPPGGSGNPGHNVGTLLRALHERRDVQMGLRSFGHPVLLPRRILLPPKTQYSG